MHAHALRRRRHADHDEEHDNHERWLLTYADLITLLLALFMMLYAMSVLDLQKYQQFQEAFTKGMGGHPTKHAEDIAPETGAVTVVSAQPNTAPALDQDDLAELKKKLEKELHAAGLQDEVQLELQPRGLVVNVVSGALFDSGSAGLTKRGQALLTSLGTVFTTFSNNLVVEGHTDSKPISSSAFPSNWELSTARATAVLRFLISAKHLRETRLSAAGYADTRPRRSNASEAGRAFNRRVDIVVVAAPRKAAPAAVPAKATSPPKAPEQHSEASGGH